MEATVYDAEGQLIAGSYMDYALPRADDVPHFEFGSHPVPATTNALGAKGCGEAGCSGALAAIMNAIVDALAERGIRAHTMRRSARSLVARVEDTAKRLRIFPLAAKCRVRLVEQERRCLRVHLTNQCRGAGSTCEPRPRDKQLLDLQQPGLAGTCCG